MSDAPLYRVVFLGRNGKGSPGGDQFSGPGHNFVHAVSYWDYGSPEKVLNP